MNKNFSEENFVSNLKISWETGENLKNDDVVSYNSPFKMMILEKFLEDSQFTSNLLTDIQNIDWCKKQMDLYHFRQSNDLSMLNGKYLKQFYEILQKEVKPWIESICNIKIERVSASCSMYNNGDYLLVHDDLLNHRQIAYVFYISPFDKQTWNENMGGALEIFNADSDGYPEYPILRKITPKNNQFLFFKVGSLSFHQVGEVTNLDYPRITINGWFYGEINKDLKSFLKPKTINIYKEPTSLKLNLSDWINGVYLEHKTKYKIQKCIEIKSEISLEDFFISNIFNKICKELAEPKLKWNSRGPASSCHYDVLDISSVDNLLKGLIELFSSEEMFKLLFEYTALDLYGKNADKPMFAIEVQRLNKGSYSVLYDDSFSEDSTLNLFIYFNSIDNVGAVTYLSRDNDGTYEDMSSDSALLTVYPQDNSLNLIYCTENQTHFTNYVSGINSDLVMPVYRLYCIYKE